MKLQKSKWMVRLVPALAIAIVALGVTSGRSSAADPASLATATSAVNWIKTQQQSDGSLEVAGFPGFETPDGVLAIAEAAQTTASWSTGQALSAVTAVRFGGSGPTPLDALDDIAESTPTAGQAAKLIVLDVLPLGLNPSDFDPSGDSPTPVDLLASLDAGCGTNSSSFGAFNATLLAMLAKLKVCGVVPPAAVITVRDAQQANGGWNYAGDPTGTDIDLDTTGLAVQALVAAGVGVTDAVLVRAMSMIATTQNTNGSWNSPFTSDDPNSTAMALIAVAATGYDSASSCWRDTFAPARTGTPYNSPDAWIRAQQSGDGHIVSPNDVWGVNTFATSQSVEALLRMWLPIARTSPAICSSGGSAAAGSGTTASSTSGTSNGDVNSASDYTYSTAARPVSANPNYAG